MHLLDAMRGEPRHRFLTGVAEGATAPEACFSPDSRYLLSGATLLLHLPALLRVEIHLISS